MLSAKSGNSPIQVSSGSREHWVDVVRGAAVFLVIFFHAFQLTELFTEHDFSRLQPIVALFSPFRMPVLFILSGMFVSRSLAKGTKSYVSGKLRNIAYPYVLWSFLVFGMIVYASNTIGWGYDPNRLWSLLYQPIDHLWFLAYLFLFYVLAGLTRRLPVPAVLLGILVLYVIPIGGDWVRFWGFAVFFMLGIMLTNAQTQFDRSKSSLVSSWLMVLAVVAASLLSQFGDARIPGPPWNAPLVLALVIGAAGVLGPVAGKPIFKPVRYLGRNSIVFYIVHYPTVNYSIKIMRDGGGFTPMQVLLAATALGVLVPLAFALLANRIPVVDALFSFPRWRPNRRSAPSGAQMDSPVITTPHIEK